jgi:hypothetical protein
MIVTMALVTTLAMPPTLRWALSRLPVHEEERSRLEREAFEAKGFLSNVERLLVAADDSANGKLAVHLAGLISGPRGIVTTVLHLGSGSPEIALRRATGSSSSRRYEEIRTRGRVTLRSGTVATEPAVAT